MYGSASITASAKSFMNFVFVFRAGTRPQCLIPSSSANSLRTNFHCMVTTNTHSRYYTKWKDIDLTCIPHQSPQESQCVQIQN